MKKLQLLGLALILSVVFTHSASGAVRSWDLDKAHSGVYFSIDHIFSKVNGHFNDIKTEINFDPANLAAIQKCLRSVRRARHDSPALADL